MTEETHAEDRRKRVVTTEGAPLGWAVRDADGDLYVEPDAGVFGGCDSWLSPSWDEAATYRLDEDAVVGVGHSTVVLAGTHSRGSSGDAGEDGDPTRASNEDTDSSDQKNAEVNP